MTRNQKILLGLAGAGVLAYFIFRGSKSQAQTTPTGTTDDNKKIANQLSNEWCEIMEKAQLQGRELNKEEEIRANQIGKQVEQLGYTGLGFSILRGVPNCNQLITIEEAIEESNKYPRF